MPDGRCGCWTPRLRAAGGRGAVYLFPRGLRDPDLLRHGPSRAELAILLEAAPVAGALRSGSMKDLSRLFRWMLLTASLVTLRVPPGRRRSREPPGPVVLTPARVSGDPGRKATDDRGAAHAQLPHRAEQVSLPALGTVDRCVTCHLGIDDPRMTDEQVPYRTHPGDYPRSPPGRRSTAARSATAARARATIFREAKATDVLLGLPAPAAALTAGHLRDLSRSGHST